MLNSECPCRYCVPPKRFPGCAATCPDWKVWHDKKAQLDAKIQSIRAMEDACFPPKLRKKGSNL